MRGFELRACGTFSIVCRSSPSLNALSKLDLSLIELSCSWFLGYASGNQGFRPRTKLPQRGFEQFAMVIHHVCRVERQMLSMHGAYCVEIFSASIGCAPAFLPVSNPAAHRALSQSPKIQTPCSYRCGYLSGGIRQRHYRRFHKPSSRRLIHSHFHSGNSHGGNFVSCESLSNQLVRGERRMGATGAQTTNAKPSSPSKLRLSGPVWLIKAARPLP